MALTMEEAPAKPSTPDKENMAEGYNAAGRGGGVVGRLSEKAEQEEHWDVI
jgi:hypothetical protein